MKQKFEIIPAIDILGGKCVRLTQGKYNHIEEFSNYPQEVAKKWLDSGAKRLHIVDLDGAREGYPVNFKVISGLVKICKAKIQVGGGIRTLKAIKEYLNEGVSYIILSTKVFKDKDFLKIVQELYGKKIIIGLDLKNNTVALSGWEEPTDISIDRLSNYLGNIRQIIYTDISKDGTLTGPNLKQIKEVASAFKSEIIISGGISSIDDVLSILNIKKQSHPNISGVILGKSIYKGTINLGEAIEIVHKLLGV